jgi:hypothetical protein
VSDRAIGTGLCNGFREAPLKSAYRNCCGSERLTGYSEVIHLEVIHLDDNRKLLSLLKAVIA